jgi:glyoxylase-like metal-dependent hydrolase (beta-lactamase superfamily II)
MRFANTFLALTLVAVPFVVTAQPPAAGAKPAAAPKATKHSDNFISIEGQGGTIGVLFGPDGVFMVDTQAANTVDAVAAVIKGFTPQPIRYIVNTHVHPDHTGGNENFAKLGATLLARNELRYRLGHPAPAANGQPGTPAPAQALSKITYDGPVTFHMNGEEIQLIPIRAAHTDGDTLVRFVKNDIIMTGDFFRSIQFPNIDRTNGGTFNGMADGLAFVIGQAGPTTKIIPGHGPIVDRRAVEQHRDMMLAIRDKIAPMVAQGKTQAEVTAAKPTADFDAKVQQPGTTADRFVGQVYAELQAAK